MRTYTLTLTAIIAVLCLFTIPAFSKGNLGFTLSQIPGDRSMGFIGGWEQELGPGELEANGQMQAGRKFLSDFHASFIFDLRHIGVRPYVNLNLKGVDNPFEDSGALGGKIDYGATLVVPVGPTEVDIGFFRRDANPFTEKTLYTLEDGEYTPVESGSGINYDNPAAWNVLGAAELEIGRAKVGGEVSYGLGVRDIWAIFTASTGVDLGGFDFNVGFTLGNRWYKDDAGQGVSQADAAFLMGISRQFL